ncbi:heterokaryon incompatibility protein-domain-containing protein [Xylaria flabelliformis]|nr:heterokaryon incompatibility protein-domain-containing protein [Xylaria flabelliformis]
MCTDCFGRFFVLVCGTIEIANVKNQQPPLGSSERTQKYHAVALKGWELYERFLSVTKTERNAPKLEEVYAITCNEFAENPNKVRNIVLRSNNVDVNLLAWLEVYSHGRQFSRNEHTAQIQADTKSGALIIQELRREHDLTPADRRMFISDILWQAYQQLATFQKQPSNKLRMIWSLRSVESEQEIVFTYLDAGFYAFLGSELGAKVSRMLIDQKSETGGVSPLSNVDLLKQVYQISLDLAPQQEKTILFENLTSSQDRHGYQYSSHLGASNIRVLSIQPGLEESPIECQLEERDLESDVIEEALSYVWGEPTLDKAIKVDGKSFRVTANLSNILRSLRCQDVPRKIWIDAVCINQYDLDEKGHQVRLMRRIYSKAQRTTIWLGDQFTKRKASESSFFGSPTDRPIDDLIPMLNKFGGNYVDGYDLPALYDAILQYQVDSAWDEKRFILSIMFLRCVNIIRRHEWWKRVWTVQEAVLPPNEPIIWFCGHTFSFSTMISAIDAADALREIEGLQSSVTPVITNLYNRFLVEQIGTSEARGDELLLRILRHGKPSSQVLLQWILSSVHAHRATDPRDKIFALESLLTKCGGRLINVNYHETTESLFRRITAQCLNQLALYPSFIRYSLFEEHHGGLENKPSGPSWVYDFTYPKAGIIDGIFQVQERINHSVEGIRQVLENVIEWWEITERRCGNQTKEHNTESVDADPGASECEGSSSGPTREEVLNLVTLGSFIFEMSDSTLPFIKQDTYRLSGTYLFITEEGILGRATAPVQKGDLLAIIDRYPNYMILRGAYDQDNLSQKKEEKRIVARGVVAESKDKMRARMNKGFQSCIFQII